MVQRVKEESKRIASKNEMLEKEKHELALLEQKKKKEEKMKSKRKAEDDNNEENGGGEENSKTVENEGSNGNDDKRPKKKRKWKDLSHLPPEERERREKQRLMQIEAATRRANGEVDTTRHPLNSERRRANRRKPGRIGKILQMKKELRSKQENLRMYNASGFNMRRAKKNGSGTDF